LEVVLETEWARLVLTPAVVIGGALFVAVAAIVSLRPFFGQPKPTPKHAHEAPPSMWLGPGLLAVLGFVLGIMPVFVAETVVAPAAAAILGEPITISLYLWHGFNVVLLLSAVTLLLGVILFLVWDRVRGALYGFDRLFGGLPQVRGSRS
jgi:multicomponent Na+:H+ antiporter subunit A